MLVVVVAALAFALFVLNRLAALQRQLDDATAALQRVQRAIDAWPRASATGEAPAVVPTATPPLATAPPAVPPGPPPPLGSPPRLGNPDEPPVDIEQEIGSRWMLLVGILVLVLGIAFFVKYSFDNHWITERTRVAVGTAAGIAAWMAGLRFTRAGYVVYGRILAGGGLAVVYVSAYAAAALYGIVPAAVSFAWMAVASGATVITAHRQRSSGLAATAIVLAYAAPFLVGSKADHHVVLLVFDALLACASLALVRRHGWPVIAATAFALTWVTFGLWFAFRYIPAWFVETEAYLTVVTAVFLAMRRACLGAKDGSSITALLLSLAVPLYHVSSVAVLFRHSVWLLVYFIAFTAGSIALSRTSATLRLAAWASVAVPLFSWAGEHVLSSWYVATIVTAAAVYLLHLAAGLRAVSDAGGAFADAEVVLFHANGLGVFGFTYLAVSSHSGSAGPLAFLLAVWNTALAVGVTRRRAPLLVHAIALAFAFLAIGIALELAGPWLTIAWAAEGFAVTWIGFRVANTRLRAGGAASIAIAVIRLIATGFGVTTVSFTPLLNSRMLAGLFIVALMYGIAALYSRRERDGALDAPMPWIVAANVLTVALITADITSYWEIRAADVRAHFARQLSVSVAWGLYAMVLVALGFRRRSAALRYLALTLFGLTVTKMFVIDLLQLGGVYRISGFVVLGLVLLLASFLYQRQREQEDAGP